MEYSRTCENCRYFEMHYVKTLLGTFVKANCGQCICENMDKTLAKRTFKQKLECYLWEDKEQQIQGRREGIEFTIKNMENFLHEIAQCLQDDRAYLDGKRSSDLQ